MDKQANPCFRTTPSGVKLVNQLVPPTGVFRHESDETPKQSEDYQLHTLFSGQSPSLRCQRPQHSLSRPFADSFAGGGRMCVNRRNVSFGVRCTFGVQNGAFRHFGTMKMREF